MKIVNTFKMNKKVSQKLKGPFLLKKETKQNRLNKTKKLKTGDIIQLTISVSQSFAALE